VVGMRSPVLSAVPVYFDGLPILNCRKELPQRHAIQCGLVEIGIAARLGQLDVLGAAICPDPIGIRHVSVEVSTEADSGQLWQVCGCPLLLAGVKPS